MYVPETPAECLSYNLGLFCRTNNMSHADAAAYIGVRESTFNNWYRKASLPIPDDAKKLEKAFHAPYKKICSSVVTLRLLNDITPTLEDIYPYNLIVSLMTFNWDCSPRISFDKYENGEIDNIDMCYRDITINEIYHAMECLTLRETMVIEYRYRDNMTLESIAAKLGVTRERIRQIELKAVCKVHRKLNAILSDKKNLQNNYIKMQKDIEYLKSKIEKYQKACANHPELADIVSLTNTEAILLTPIEDLELSVRTYNCLCRANIRTVGDIVHHDGSFYKIRNLGRKCVVEIINKIKEYGLPYKFDINTDRFIEVIP